MNYAVNAFSIYYYYCAYYSTDEHLYSQWGVVFNEFIMLMASIPQQEVIDTYVLIFSSLMDSNIHRVYSSSCLNLLVQLLEWLTV